MEDKIKLFLRYMKKEKELTLQWDREEGIDVDAEDYKLNLLCVGRVKSFINYRNIRIEEAWYSKLTKGDTSREVSEKIIEYDCMRTKAHARALSSLADFNKFGEMYGLPKFYDGELLDSKDIEDYRNIKTRKEETDFFLSFIDAINRTPMSKMLEYFSEVGLGSSEKSFLHDLQSNIEKTNRAYGVSEPFLSDDDDIKFKDDGKYI